MDDLASPIPTGSRVDFLVIAEMIEEGARVLDVGCSDGALLKLLTEERNVDGRGIEISQSGVNRCVARGLSVVQGDGDTDLAYYPDGAFDYVILSQTVQAMKQPVPTLHQALRIGRHVVVSFPNFGYWKIRFQVGVQGRMPMTDTLPVYWYETPNIHFCTVRDFVEMCTAQNIVVRKQIALNHHGRRVKLGGGLRIANLFAEQAVLLLSR